MMKRPANLQRESISQQRRLFNAGALANATYTKGIHNIKAGATFEDTLLDENDHLGIVDYTLNAPCLNSSGMPVEWILQSDGSAEGRISWPTSIPIRMRRIPHNIRCSTQRNRRYDLTRGGGSYRFVGHADIRQFSTYLQDTISVHNWSFN